MAETSSTTTQRNKEVDVMVLMATIGQCEHCQQQGWVTEIVEPDGTKKLLCYDCYYRYIGEWS